MAKDQRDRMAVNDRSSRGSHGGYRGGGKDDRPKRSDPEVGKDPHRGGPLANPPRAKSLIGS